MTPILCVGTAGMSVWFSDDLGETWNRPLSESGLYLESRVWALASHPARPGTIFAGTDIGFYRGNLADQTWRHLPSPMDDMEIWSLAIDPRAPDIIVAGTRPAALYRTEDGGEYWSK